MYEKLVRIKELREEGFSWIGIFLRLLDYMGIRMPNKSIINNIKELLWINYVRIVNKIRFGLKKDSNRILIIETGVLGDCMLVIPAIQRIILFCHEHNYRLTLVCNYGMKKIFSDYAGITDVEYVCFKNRDDVSLEQFKALNAELNVCKYKYIVLRDSNSFGFRLVGSLSGTNKLYYSYDVKNRNKLEMKMVNRFFTDVKSIENVVFIPDVWKCIMERIGIEEYRTCVGKLLIPESIDKAEKSILPNGEYVLFCPEASTRNRSIDIDKCNEILRFISSTYPDMKIVISTDCRNEEYVNELRNCIKDTEILDYSGKTTIDQFAYLVSKAKLLIGCDSGAIHLAAGLRTPCICLTGYWDMPHFVPYVFEEKVSDEFLPIIIYPREKPMCAYCGDRCEYARNEECKKRIENHMSLKCINDIDNVDIFNSVNEILRCER